MQCFRFTALCDRSGNATHPLKKSEAHSCFPSASSSLFSLLLEYLPFPWLSTYVTDDSSYIEIPSKLQPGTNRIKLQQAYRLHQQNYVRSSIQFCFIHVRLKIAQKTNTYPDWEWTERTCLVDWEMSFHCFREILTCAEPASHRLFCHCLWFLVPLHTLPELVEDWSVFGSLRRNFGTGWHSYCPRLQPWLGSLSHSVWRLCRKYANIKPPRNNHT